VRALLLVFVAALVCLGAHAATAVGEGSTAELAPSATPRSAVSGVAVEPVGPVTPRQPLLRAAVALAGACVLLFGVRAARGAAWRRRLRDALLLGLGVAGGLLWINPLTIARGQLHPYEFFHYYLGAKYSSELGHSRLYACTTVADLEDGLVRRVERRAIRNLETYAIESTGALVGDPDRCKSHFSAERWQLFREDVRFFRQRLPPTQWERMLKDHGYNGTPVWALLGSALAGSGPVSAARIRALALVDPLLLAAMGGAVAWAFGWRTLCVALIFLGTFAPAPSRWTAGAYLRQDWLLASVAGVCLLRRQRPAAAGAAFAFAGLLRIFPFVMLAGVGARALAGMLRERRLRISREHVRLGVAALLVSAGLLALSSPTGEGFDAWPRFFDKARLHLDSPLLNYMGLATVLSYDPAFRSARTLRPSLDDPLATWKRARKRTLAARLPAYWMLVAGLGLLLLFAVRDQPDWAAAALGIGLVPVAGELTCYYYAVFFAYALLAARRVAVGVMLLCTAALSQAVEVHWAVIDEVFAAQSLLIITCVVAVMGLFAWPRRQEPAPSWLDTSTATSR
jgi:hypothetical protein